MTHKERETLRVKSQIFDQDTGQAGPDTQGVPDEWSATTTQVHLEMYDKQGCRQGGGGGLKFPQILSSCYVYKQKYIQRQEKQLSG